MVIVIGDWGHGFFFGGGARRVPQNSGKYFSDICCHIKFGHFVNFLYTYFRAKMSSPLQLTERLRPCDVDGVLDVVQSGCVPCTG